MTDLKTSVKKWTNEHIRQYAGDPIIGLVRLVVEHCAAAAADAYPDAQSPNQHEITRFIVAAILALRGTISP